MTVKEPPIPYYDLLAKGSIEARVRSLDEESLREQLAYELEHERRPQILALMRLRLAALSPADAELTG